MKKYIIENLEQIDSVAEQILNDFKDERLFVLEGDMGRGKTTLTKAFCKCLGATDNVCSPTFAIINEYYSPNHKEIYHFDFYRLNKAEEALDIGIEEYLYSGQYCFMEWSERIAELLPENKLVLEIVEKEDKKREVIIRA